MTKSTRQIQIGQVTIGGPAIAIIAGPCSIESEAQFLEAASQAKKAGAHLLRGGIYKLRTHPQSFQGLGDPALAIAESVRKKLGMPLVSEITDPRQIEGMISIIDVFQVGTRNMYNYPLLKELGKTSKPVLLKRSFSASIEEWLLAAEYIESSGNPNVILCERGIRTFERATRNTLDLSAVAFVKQHSTLPVIVDPSHATGRRDLIEPMSLAAIAAGADGLLIEMHPNAAASLSDGHQAIDGEDLARILSRVEKLGQAIDRPILRLA
ncbi:MAG: 3-deoxy-7-phosphoheptulonate synthase [Deltaproteobacteria bacterium]|nr:3-deoxy-7-phosphoheptulonate synthase [Deltaproteobacteria bacterium]